MKYLLGALIGFAAGACLGWLAAGVADMLIEPALLVIEVTSVLGLIIGVVGARRLGGSAASR